MSFQFAYRGVSGVPRIALVPIAASQTLSKGDPLVRSSGVATAAAAGVSAATFIGILNEDIAAPAAGTLVEVILADDETVFKIELVSGTTKTYVADADLATLFDLGATTDFNKVTLDDTTGGCILPVKTSVAGDTHIYGKVAHAYQDLLCA
jgi:hypothetical protein